MGTEPQLPMDPAAIAFREDQRQSLLRLVADIDRYFGLDNPLTVQFTDLSEDRSRFIAVCKHPYEALAAATQPDIPHPEKGT